MSERNLRKTRTGMVVSDKMDKTVVVAVIDNVRHPLCKKIVKRTVKFKAHDEQNACGIGDTVMKLEISMGCIRKIVWISKLKYGSRFRVLTRSRMFRFIFISSKLSMTLFQIVYGYPGSGMSRIYSNVSFWA